MGTDAAENRQAISDALLELLTPPGGQPSPELVDKVRAWADRASTLDWPRIERTHSAPVPLAGWSTQGAPAGASRLYSPAKRVFDFVVAGLGLVVLGPVIAILALLVKFDSPGPALYGHERLTLGGRRFRCWKLRTMLADAEEQLERNPRLKTRYVQNDYKVPMEEDPRITRFGHFLRRTSLDELPQLWNVLVGEMSLVGPRPIVGEELEWYRPFTEELLSVRPGITGAWQIMGRSRIGYPDRVIVELGYVWSRSLARDFRILALSIPAVISARGAL